MTETTLTLRFRGTEANLLHEMVDSGLFNTKSEAVRAAIVNYSMALGLLKRRNLWEGIRRHSRRNVSQQQLAKDLRNLEK